MVPQKVRVARSFFYILSGLILWSATAPIGALFLTKPLIYGILSVLIVVLSAIGIVVRYGARSGEVSLFTSAALLLGPLALTMAPLVLVIGLAEYWPFQYSALILLYVLGIVAFVVAGAVQLRRGIIEHRQEQGAA